MDKNENTSEAAALRRKAEELLKKRSEAEILELVLELALQNEEKAKRAGELVIANKELAFQNEEKAKRADELSIAIANSLKLTHELEVHQIELEMQNEELIMAKEQIAKAATDKYAELYDFSPSGYFTLSKEGIILELNLCGAMMLGRERSYLKNRPFVLFISDDTKETFYLFLRKVFSAFVKETCEVALPTDGNSSMYVHLTGIATEHDDQCRVTVVDITGRKLAENALLASENRMSEITRCMADWIWEVDKNGVYTYASEKSFDFFGYAQEEVIGKTPFHFMPPDEAARVAAIFFEIKSKGLPIKDIENWNIGKNGRKICVLTNGFPILDNNGNLSGYRGVDKDITQHKIAEDTLRHSEELLKTVVSNSTDLTILTNAGGQILFVSPQCETVLGYPGDTFIGLQMPDIIHPDDTELDRTAWDGIFHAGKELRDIEYRIHDETGAVRWLSHSAKTYSINGVVVGVVSTIRHITNRKMADQTLKLSEEKYRTMLNASPDCMVLTNMKGIIVEVSEIGLHLLGADSRDDLVGKLIFQFVSSDEQELLKELLAKTTYDGFTQNIGVTIRKQNQSVFTGEISATLMQSADGTPVSFMIIIRDISQRKEMEAKQIHTDRMSTLGEMAAGIAHEVNQPLNIISMVMDKILFEAFKAESIDAGFLKNKSDKIFENITRIRDIIDHVRDFSRSHDNYVLTAFNVNSSIINASSMIVEQFKHHGIILNIQLEQQMPTIVGNTFKFEQVILNLLINAKDAVTEKKNKVVQDFDMLVGIRSRREDQFIIVEITDNGIGIGNDDIKNIMLPFYTTKEEGKGTGLGLSISYQIIKEMNGTIEITSDSSSGTKVKLVLHVQKTK